MTDVGVEPPILYWTLTLPVPLPLICEVMLNEDNVNVVLEFEVIEIKYHFDPEEFVERLPLNPLPLIPVVALAQVTPLPLEI